MKTKLFLSAVLVIFIMLLSACTKEDKYQLPPETQTGKNTFGCKVNGVIYKTSGRLIDLGWGPSLQTSGVNFSGDEYIKIKALVRNRDREEKIIYLSFRYEGRLGLYTEKTSTKGENPITTSSFINVTRFDNGILSGTFSKKTEFYDENGTPMNEELTEGRFDINKNKTE